MIQMNVSEAKTNLSRLIAEAENGEEVFIARHGKPAVKIVPAVTEDKKPREFGFEPNMWIADDFDAPMSEEELALWE